MASKPRNRILDYMAYKAFCIVRMGLQMMPLSAGQRIGAVIGGLGGRLDRKHFNRAMENLETAFPEWDLAQRRACARKVFRHLGMLGAELAWLPKIWVRGNWRDILDVRQREVSDRAMARGKGVIVLTGHFGNWEIGCTTASLLGYRTHTVYRPLHNPYLDAQMRELRRSQGQNIIPQQGALKQIIKLLRKGEMIVMVPDEDARHGGIFVDFFGKPRSVLSSIASIALRTGATVVPASVHRLPQGGRFIVHFECEILPEDYASMEKDQAVHAMTQDYMTWFETIIRRYPEQWLWQQRHWKFQPPEATEKGVV